MLPPLCHNLPESLLWICASFGYPVPSSTLFERFLRKTSGKARLDAVSTLRAGASTKERPRSGRCECTRRSPRMRRGEGMGLLREGAQGEPALPHKAPSLNVSRPLPERGGFLYWIKEMVVAPRPSPCGKYLSIEEKRPRGLVPAHPRTECANHKRFRGNPSPALVFLFYKKSSPGTCSRLSCTHYPYP